MSSCIDCGQAILSDGLCVDCSLKRRDDYPELKTENKNLQEIVQRLQDKISDYKVEPHEHRPCCGCELTEQAKAELKILESILHGSAKEANS